MDILLNIKLKQNRCHGKTEPTASSADQLLNQKAKGIHFLNFFIKALLFDLNFCLFVCNPPVIHVPRYEDCVSSDSSADSIASSRGSDQAWDVDSFDDESEYQPPDRMCPIEEEIKLMRLYRPKMNRSKVILFYDILITPRRIIQHLWILKLSLYIGFLCGWRNLPWGNCLFLSG